eukprot:3945132-Alexandrium_andersonii.AAC.1
MTAHATQSLQGQVQADSPVLLAARLLSCPPCCDPSITRTSTRHPPSPREEPAMTTPGWP